MPINYYAVLARYVNQVRVEPSPDLFTPTERRYLLDVLQDRDRETIVTRWIYTASDAWKGGRPYTASVLRFLHAHPAKSFTRDQIRRAVHAPSINTIASALARLKPRVLRDRRDRWRIAC